MVKNLRLHDQSLFFLGSTGVVSGIFLTNIFWENTIFLLLFVCIVSIQILFFFRSFFLPIVVYIILFCFGGYLSLERLHEIDTVTKLFEQETMFFTKETVISGTLAEKISDNDKSARYILRDITIGTQKFPQKIGILLIFPDSRRKNIDDVISFTGALQLPQVNNVFDYQTYLLLDNIYATTSVSFPDMIGKNPSNPLGIFIRNIREKLLSIIENTYP